MSNSKKTYNDFIRTNLPAGMTFDSTRVRYVVNGKPFVTYIQAEWYLNYIKKFGFTTGPPPTLTNDNSTITATGGKPQPPTLTNNNSTITAEAA